MNSSRVAVVIDSTVDAKLLIGVFSEDKIDRVVDAYAQSLKNNGQDIVLESKAIDQELSDDDRTVYTYMLDSDDSDDDEPCFFICVYWTTMNDTNFNSDVEIC